MPGSVLTTEEAARLLGVTPARVRQIILDGRLPAMKVGRDWQIRRIDLTLVMHRKPGRPRR